MLFSLILADEVFLESHPLGKNNLSKLRDIKYFFFEDVGGNSRELKTRKSTWGAGKKILPLK